MGGRPEREDRIGIFTATNGMPPWIPRLLFQIVALIILLWASYHVARQLRSFLVILGISLFLSIALEPGVVFLVRRGWKRGLATFAMLGGAIIVLVASVAVMVPVVISQTARLADRIPRYVAQLAEFGARFGIDVSEQRIVAIFTGFDASLEELATDLAGTILGVGGRVLGTVFSLLTIGLFTFYMTADAPRIRRAVLRTMSPQRQRMLLEVQEIAIEKTGAYVYSRVLLAAVAAFITWIALRIIGVPFPEPLALWVGVMSQFVPVVGTYIGGLLPVLIALLESPGKALWVLVVIVAYQQFENYFVSPRITARTMSMHPAVAFGSAIVGATLMGAPGALIALPVAATIQAWVSAYIERHEVVESHRLSKEGEGDEGEPSPRRRNGIR